MAEQDDTATDYRVLARKYRPTSLDGLRGQDALVRTLRNAVASGRIAQAFLLTGVRGVGKTTTARILARILNCVGPDGSGGVTAEPCGVCEQCVAIAEDRHVDVLEIDAASHTGIDNMRELLEAARYRPVMGRYKIYVMDEVHMLSNAAFNALLKTLEEPPEHLKFVFATTELRKIPATILSRCQRFDLRRIDAGELQTYFAELVGKEGAEASDDALALIARAADGSARDGLSILDQAIAQGQGKVAEDDVRDMLGLADRGLVFDLYEAVMGGDIAKALANLDGQYAAGVDPVVVLEDLLEFTHWLTRYKAAPEAASYAAPEFERERGSAMAQKLTVPHLTRAWQILLKGINEARTAPNSLQAVEMTLVRVAHSADLPTPEEALKTVLNGGTLLNAAGSAAAPAAAPSVPSSSASEAVSLPEPEPVAPPPTPAPAPAEGDQASMPATFGDLLVLLETQREARLRAMLRGNVHLVAYEPGKIEFRPDDLAPPELSRDLARTLETITGARWMVAISSQPGADTIVEQEEAWRVARIKDAEADPGVAGILDAFPGAEVVAVHDPEDIKTESTGS
ncbi:MAG: DNA polymerase III subunit gamma/tau [Rhodospirillaceae bacterium]|nr:DNA polymerase III subunit gamma/tau [Rhodospirillaceae bacterium]|tara:strand:+ start:31159 stop:32871 length:1713 start_codon:yes stop_codon:yes gene_type:complete